MVQKRLTHYLKDLGYQILDKEQSSLNNNLFDVVTVNNEGEKLYIKVVEKKESNDVYSPKGDINRKIDDIVRLVKTLNFAPHFAIAVPDEFLYERILNNKLLSISSYLKAFLVGNRIVELQFENN